MDKLLILNKISSKGLGNLSFFESHNQIPFEIKRIYYTYDVPVGVKRGMHAHKKLQQILWCPYGTIEVILDDGLTKTNYHLDSPNKALIVSKGYWHEMYWRNEESVLCVAASDYYDENDYIRDYGEFMQYVERDYWKYEDTL
ncbi:MAG: WxcM-like domain-containing protein [Peptococcaceae bacterium]|nr:WxcM-like domain-containing protein [Peptococcaceae bacterium]